MPNEPKLMSCPFCGGWAEMMMDVDVDGDEYTFVECQGCFAQTDGSFTMLGKQAIADAAERWNRRATDGAK